MAFQLLAKSVTLNEMNGVTGRYIRLFHRIRQENPYFCFTCRIELSSVLFWTYRILFQPLTLI